MTVSETQIERGMKALHEVSTYRGYNQETLDREWVRMERIYRAHVTAILTAALSDQAVVPKEPTEEMLIAGVVANQSRMVGEVYRAMIAAAPSSLSGYDPK